MPSEVPEGDLDPLNSKISILRSVMHDTADWNSHGQRFRLAYHE